MDQIRREINDSFPPADSNCDFIVPGNDVISVIPKLNSSKSDGNGSLSIYHVKTPVMIYSFMCRFYSRGCLLMELCQMICS